MSHALSPAQNTRLESAMNGAKKPAPDHPTITRILAKGAISIDAMVQKEPPKGEAHADIIMLTHQTVEKRIDAAIAAIEKLKVVVGKVTRIRMEPLGTS